MVAGPRLSAVAREWTTYRSPRILLAALPVLLVLRMMAGGWSTRDAWVAGAFVVAQPFTEWLIHVYVLHWKPRVVFGRVVDPYAGRSHRRHHEDPKNPHFLFIHISAVRGGLVLDAVLFALAFTVRPSFGTAALTSLALTTTYEWTHYLIHSDYVPRSRFYRGLWRAHRLHHFRNENFWYGVTSHVGDRALRTYPAKEDVPLSPTATRLAQAYGSIGSSGPVGTTQYS